MASKRFADDGTYVLPKPRFQTFNDRQTDLFFDYWTSLSVKLPGYKPPVAETDLVNVIVRVYRSWPRRKVKVAPPEGGPAANAEIFRFEGACPFQIEEIVQNRKTVKRIRWRDGWLDKFGSGKYGIYLGEQGVSGAVCYASIGVQDDERPPKVAIEDVDVSHPDNRGYVQSLRDAGIKIPGDEGYQSEAEKEAQAMQEAQQTTLVEKVVSMASELGEMRGELRNPPAKEPDPTETAASLAAIQTLQEITSKAVDSAERRAEVASRGQDLPTMMKVLSELAERMKPDPTVLSAALSRSAELEKALLQMQQGLIERAEREAAFYREAALKPGASAAAAPSAAGPVDLVGEFRKAKELVELFSPPAATASRESSAFFERNLPAILQAAQNIIGRIGETVHNAAVAKTGQGIPVAPAPIAAAPQSPGSPVSTDPDVAYALSRNVPTEVIDELKRITEPLCSHFTGTPDTNGYSFANWIVTGGTAAMEDSKGRGQYQLMKAAGADALLQLLQAWRPIWSRIGGFPPQRIQQFIAEFLDYDDWLARQQEPEPPGPAPSLRVV